MDKLLGDIERFGKGVGNASRSRIVESLLRGRKTVGDLVKIVGASQPAVSQHLKVLKESGLVIDERRGQEVFYSLNAEHMLRLLKNLSARIEQRKKKK